MKFTDLFIKRPVLSSVVSLLILFFGINSLLKLPIRQFPKMNSTVISVTTSYPGADSSLISGFITTPLEAAIASSEGIDYMTSESVAGTSNIDVYLKVNFNPDRAFTDIMSKVQQVKNNLPPNSQEPVIIKKSDSSTALLYISLNSTAMTPQQITDYALRVAQPELQTIAGVADVNVLGGQTYAMRIFLNPIRMAATNVSPEDISQVLAKNNYLTAAGSTKGEYISINLRAKTNMSTPEEFKNLIVRTEKNAVIKLKDVAKIELGSENYDSSVRFDGKKAVFLAISATPTANPLTVIKDIRKLFPIIQQQFPPSLSGTIVYDATEYIHASINDVLTTIIESAVIVIFVIYLFLGSLRSVLIPIVTIPLSLIGVCTLIMFLGYSINLLTLLAFVLAIGLVVDDAIVVVENIHRHIEHGLSPLDAALIGAREIATPVIAMTITLAAVYAPIGFMDGLTGTLFKEFAFTLACSVIISGIIALSLSPMMCSKILSSEVNSGKFALILDKFFDNLQIKYQQILHEILNSRAIIAFLALVVLTMLPYLYSHTAKETAPEEDAGFFFVISNAPEAASLNYIEAYTKTFDKIYSSFPEAEHSFTINLKTANSGVVLKPWSKRKKTQFDLKEPLQNKLNAVAGLQSYVIIPPALPGAGGGTPVKFIIKSSSDFKSLVDVSDKLTKIAKSSGLFMFLDNTLKYNHPEIQININRTKASDLGLDMEDIGKSISGAMSGGYVNFFDLQGRSYKVIPQLERKYRLDVDQVNNIYVNTKSGSMVPLSTIVDYTKTIGPNQKTHFQQLNSAMIQGIMLPGHTLGEGLKFLKDHAIKILPSGFSYDYAGQSRQFMQEGNSLMIAFFLAIVVIYLVLAAQYESFRDPLIILISVPMSVCGALIPLNLGASSINIYTQVGLITLIGLISKHGILIVDFANKLQIEKKLSKRNAVEEAAAIRLRPILMTTAAMVFGVSPLLIASGAGAVSRFDIGIVITSGLLIGTLFTLFVIPTIYTYLAKDHTNKS
ncbi:MAG: multidrug efflux protein [Legionellales bacterium RIFCSPHIGHO2_12_FULL_35_11]|nr:MAG: multidrug efflux protein [Legionellales bacterium RIFCSPHIGHO2_12_FULL_35_11]